MIPIYETYFFGNEKKYLLNCIDTNWISSQGSYVSKLEIAIADYHNSKYAITTSNCTSALHLSLKSLNIGHGDEVICPNLTFISPANMILLSGAKLVLVDIDPHSLTIDPNLIEKKITNKTKALIVVHQFGHAAHMDEILDIANRYKIDVIEDNAESIGATYKGKMLGTFGKVSAYSFFGNKIITTGEGGALLTNEESIAMKIRELRDHGMNHKKKYHHVDLGYNYRMTNMQAAIGLAQMEKLDQILSIRKNQMKLYYNELSGVQGITLRDFADWCEPVHWLMTIKLDKQFDREKFLDFMRENNVECRQMVNPVHLADHIKEKITEKFPVSCNISNQSVHLPSGLALTESQIKKITDLIKAYLVRKQ